MKRVLLILIILMGFQAFAQEESSFFELEAQRTRIGNVDFAHLELFDKKRCDLYFRDMNSLDGEYVKFSFKYADINVAHQLILKKFEVAAPYEIVKVKANGELVGFKYLVENGQKLVQFIKYKSDNSDTGISVSKLYTIEDINKLFNK